MAYQSDFQYDADLFRAAAKSADSMETSSPPGFMAATILLPLETSIPTTVIRFPPNLNLQWLPPFTYCLFNLLSNTNAPLRWDYLRKSNAANKNGG